MSKLITCLRQEGLVYTIRKFFCRLRKKESVTEFLRCQSLNQPNKQCSFAVKSLKETDIKDFNRIKFFEHVDGRSYINAENKMILVAYDANHLLGYIAAEWDVDKKIHGLGNFYLCKGESWIGPVYVKKEYRNNGISSCLINKMSNYLKNQFGIEVFYTCINATNLSSLNSFFKNGYSKVGSVRVNADKCNF